MKWLQYCFLSLFQCATILLQLEERLRAEILQHLKQREGAEATRNVADINLDEDYSSGLESR